MSTRAAIARAKTGVPLSPEHRLAVAAGHQRWWANATDEEKAARPYPRGPWNRFDTSIERAVASVLDELGEPYEEQKRIANWVADFYLGRLSETAINRDARSCVVALLVASGWNAGQS